VKRLALALLFLAAPAFGSGNPWPGKGGADGDCDGALETIAAGVTACNKNTGDGFTSTSEVWIKPTRLSATDENSIVDPLEGAFEYCYNNTPTHSDISYSGSSALYHGCTIHVDSDIWLLDDTAFLTTTTEKIGSHITIDGNGGVWALKIPEPDGSSTIAELTTTHAAECDGAEDAGNFRRVTNPGTPELYENGVLTASTAAAGGVTITAIDDNTGDCAQKYGKDTIKVTAASHGLRDGLSTFAIGDLVQIDGVNNASAAIFNGGEDGSSTGIYLVKEVLDANNFCVTADFNGAALTAGTTGTAEPLDSTAWCNGSHWQAGWPGVYIGGGPTGEPVSDVKLENVTFRFDTTFTDYRNIRQRAIVLDSDFSTAGTDGGFTNIKLENISATSTSLNMAQVIIDVGGPGNVPGTFSGQGVWVDVVSDFGGSAWAKLLLIRNVSHVWATVFGQHGGGIQIGEGENLTVPSNIVVRGSLGGCGNGPCVDIPGGTSINIDDMELSSDINGPLSGSGLQRDSGWILRVGDPNNTAGVVLNSNNMRVKVQDDSDRDWYVAIAGPVLSWMWKGGKIQKGDGGDTGTGTGTFLKIDDGAIVGQLDWRNIAESDTDAGAIVPLVDLSAGPTINFLCPNCESGPELSQFTLDAGSNMAANQCLTTNGAALVASCANDAQGDVQPDDTLVAFTGGRQWYHDGACSIPTDDAQLDAGEAMVLGVYENDSDGSGAMSAVTGATLTFLGSEIPGKPTDVMNALGTLTEGSLALAVTTVGDATTALGGVCTVRHSTLVADTP
jgi:hypothetical protein